jgi:4-hydroxythreonine-4-phosphate dehydrogenase
MGDASGIGPEIIVQSYLRGTLPQNSVVFGDSAIMQRCAEILAVKPRIRTIDSVSEWDSGALNIIEHSLQSSDDLTPGKINAKSGFAAVKYVETATSAALQKEISAVVTLPINKEATRLTESDFSGHTEFIAHMCECDNYTMMLASDKLLVTHVSTHIALQKAVKKVKKQRIVDVIKLTAAATAQMRMDSRIAVAGLNPHAGENRAFGDEEHLEIAPAVAAAQSLGLDVEGPQPPDTVYVDAVNGRYDAVVAMYHDQGHIAMKLLSFDSAVNITLGLPIIRTSVDHGTAFNIAYQGKASTKSFENACLYAMKLKPFVLD